MKNFKKTKPLYICLGENCRDVGGKLLSEQLENLGIDYNTMPCQSLCTYAPTGKRNGRAILRAKLEDLYDNET